jgi:hypothetical protein
MDEFGSSTVRPARGFTNPTQTLIALALRLANHLQRGNDAGSGIFTILRTFGHYTGRNLKKCWMPVFGFR